ncbi:MAG: Ribosomal RNA small subunit methyltransferase A [Opitutia bacterium UBA7350]|nr:MAG: Ribosomal RNA small subunit methyltransferase A [Opitutae bacterium UBA7350]
MPLNPNQTRQLLENLAHLPNKKLGQNFLVDGNIVRKSLELAELKPEQAVVEIGPGLGTLTRALLEKGHSVWAVERDRTLAAYLRRELVPAQPNLHLTEADCLDLPRAALPDSIAETGYQVVANLPYAVSTPWMDSLLAGLPPERMVLMLQKEAGDRYTASHATKNFGAISIFLQSAYTVTGRHHVSSTCFHPAPKVDSLLLRLDRRSDAVCFNGTTRECIRRIFTQRRKQLGSLCRKEDSPSVLLWFESLIEKGYPATARPEEIPSDEWIRLKL